MRGLFTALILSALLLLVHASTLKVKINGRKLIKGQETGSAVPKWTANFNTKTPHNSAAEPGTIKDLEWVASLREGTASN